MKQSVTEVISTPIAAQSKDNADPDVSSFGWREWLLLVIPWWCIGLIAVVLPTGPWTPTGDANWFVETMSAAFPMIQNVSRYSQTPESIAFSLAILWAFAVAHFLVHVLALVSLNRSIVIGTYGPLRTKTQWLQAAVWGLLFVPIFTTLPDFGSLSRDCYRMTCWFVSPISLWLVGSPAIGCFAHVLCVVCTRVSQSIRSQSQSLQQS